jgi:trans-aconitate methyltransferase
MSDEFEPSYWEDRYRRSPAHGDSRPSPQLVTEVGDLSPGTALELGCGEGANALWLASRGWRVTAVDVAPTALGRARDRAATMGADVAGRVDWVEADITEWQPASTYDLVTAHYVHPGGDQEVLVHRLAAAAAPGATLLVVDHDHADEHAEIHVSTRELVARLPPGWTVETSETRIRQDMVHGGRTVTLHDVVLRARRTG